MEDIGFIILRHVNDELTNNYWLRCYSSIRCFYPESPVLIIDDNSNKDFVKAEFNYSNLTIIQYDEFIRKIYAVELIDAYPIGISSQPLSWSEEGFHRVSVQFTYQKYRVVYSGSYDLAAAAAALFGAKAAPLFNKVGQSISNTFVNPIARVLL